MSWKNNCQQNIHCLINCVAVLNILKSFVRTSSDLYMPACTFSTHLHKSSSTVMAVLKVSALCEGEDEQAREQVGKREQEKG